MEYDFAHTELAEQALRNEARILVEEEGLSEDDAMRVAAATMDGAGDHVGQTVESIQTCMDLFGKPVKGLSTSDIPNRRGDEYAASEAKRHEAADKKMDSGALWIKLSSIDGGRTVANKIAEIVDQKPDELIRFWHLIRACVEKKFSDPEIIKLLEETVK